jgi:hypothetical protein
MYNSVKDTKGIHRFCNCRNLQNPGTAFRCRGAWDADRCEKRANILTDLSRSYALCGPGSWISVPALCKSELFRSQPVLAGTNFPRFRSWLNILPQNSRESFEIYKTRARHSGAEGPGMPIGVKRGRIF